MALINSNSVSDWERNCQTQIRQMASILDDGEEAYQVWQTFRNARDDATIAAALGTTETIVNTLDSAYAALHELHEFARNQTPVQGDYRFAMRQLMG